MSEEEALMDGIAPLSYWLIARHKKGQLDVHTFDLPGGEEVLPIFSRREEAAVFLRIGMWRTGWRPRETTAETLISLLLGPCASVGRVALDPWPEIDTEMMVALVGIRRENFVDLIMGKGKPLDPAVKRKASAHTARPGFCHSTVDKGVVAEERVHLRRRLRAGHI
jgi:hypothetical protein